MVIQKNIYESEIDNAFPLQLPSGCILLTYRYHDKNPDTSFKIYRITVSYSDDGGSTWAYLLDFEVREATPTNNGLWEPFFRIAEGKKL